MTAFVIFNIEVPEVALHKDRIDRFAIESGRPIKVGRPLFITRTAED